MRTIAGVSVLIVRPFQIITSKAQPQRVSNHGLGGNVVDEYGLVICASDSRARAK